MKTSCKFLATAIVAVVFAFGLFGPITVFAATSPTLGAVGSYSVLGHTTVTNTGATTMPGDLGISIGGAPTGFPPGVVGPPGTVRNAADSLLAQDANTAAFGALDQGCDFILGAGLVDLGGMNLIPGVYCAGSFGLTGVLTLSGGAGDVYIFKAASTLVTQPGSSVTGGDACNVWWRVGSSATLDTTTAFIGNILALTSISMNTGADLSGRALAQTGAVTLQGNDITGAACLSASVSSPEEENNDNKDVDIKVTKKADPSSLSGPGYVTYTYKVSNEGNVELKNVSVEDDKCSPVVYVSGRKNKNGKLDTDEVWKYTCTKRVSATETNKATAKGTANGKKVHDHAKATVVVSSVPGFPNAGIGPEEKNTPWNIVIPAGILMLISTSLSIVKRKRNFSLGVLQNR